MVPNTWRRSYWNPEVVDWHRIQSVNTGWEMGIQGIGTGRTLIVDTVQNKGTHHAPFAAVESGNSEHVFLQSDPGAWCCDWWDLFCSADDCAEQDLQAAIEMAENEGGGIVTDGAGGPPVAVVEVDPNAWVGGTTVLKPGDPGFEEKAAEAQASGKKTIVKETSPQPMPPPGVTPPDLEPPPVALAGARGRFNPWMALAGVALVGAVWYFQKGNK